MHVAAAGVTVGDFVAELDIPIPGLDKVQPWIPKLNVGGDSGGENTALQVSLCSEQNHAIGDFDTYCFIRCFSAKAVIKKELTTKRGPRSSNRFLLNPTDRRRLENTISQTSHRGLRMLCVDEVLNMNIDCPIDSSRGEFACVRVEDVRLDINKIKDLVEPILRKLVNPPDNDGYFDLVADPASYLDYPIPGISDIAGVSKELQAFFCPIKSRNSTLTPTCLLYIERYYFFGYCRSCDRPQEPGPHCSPGLNSLESTADSC